VRAPYRNRAEVDRLQRHASRWLKKKSTCFTSTKVQLLTQKWTASNVTLVGGSLAVLVQTYLRY
jgi:hypothetical protein